MSPFRLAVPVVLVLSAAAAVAQQPPAAVEKQRVAPAEQHGLTAAEAQALIGKSVFTSDGQSAGAIRDFTLAGPDGRIDRIVLASGGFFGIGERMVSVPANLLRIDAAQKLPAPGKGKPVEVLLELTADDMVEAPDFDYAEEPRTLVGRR